MAQIRQCPHRIGQLLWLEAVELGRGSLEQRAGERCVPVPKRRHSPQRVGQFLRLEGAKLGLHGI
eukprot:354237-Chlamydomonas_euryale.AAC.2